MQIQKQGLGIRGIGFIKLKALKCIFDLPYCQNILFVFKISSKYQDVVLKASMMSACLSSERDIIK